MPALAQTKPWWVSQITVPPRRRTIRRLSERISSQSAGVLPVSSASARAAGPGRTSASTTRRPSALLTTFWATIRTSPGTTPSAPARVGEHPGEVVAGPDLGEGRQRPEPQRALPASSVPAISSARAGRQRRARPAARHQGRQVARGVDVEGQGGALAEHHRQAAPGGLGAVARQRVEAEAGREGARRAQQHGVGAGAVHRGHEHRPGAGRGGGEHGLEVLGAGQRQVGGQHERPLGAGGGHLLEPAHHGGVHPPRRGVVGHHAGAGDALGHLARLRGRR